MNIKYISIEFNNFKGAMAELSPVKVDFTLGVINKDQLNITTKNNLALIGGKNAAGKTTVLDAISFLFINKLWNGKTSGWESLDSFNEPTLKKPIIHLWVAVDETLIEIKLENGKRYINGVLTNTLIDFKNTLLKINLDVDQFLMCSNPFFILEYSTVNDARNILIKKTITSAFETEVENIFTNHNLTKMYEPQLIKDVLTMIKLLPAPKVLISTEMQLRKKQVDLQSFNSELTRFENFNAITADEKIEVEKTAKLKSKEAGIMLELNRVGSLMNKPDKCFNCGSAMAVTVDLGLLTAEWAKLNADLQKVTSSYDPVRFGELLRKSSSNTDLNRERIVADIKFAELEIQKLNTLIEILKIYNVVYNQRLENSINEVVPFTLKMFHKNKSVDSVKEVFSITKNGVDYNFLNQGEKIIIGVALINYLFPDSAFPILIDGIESLDAVNTNALSKYKQQIIATKVK